MSEKTAKAIRLENIDELQEGFNASMRKRRIEFFARVFTLKPLKNNVACPLLGLHPKTISAYKNFLNRENKDISVKTKFLYRAIKNLRPEIVSFLLNDNNFDAKYCIKKEKREEMLDAIIN